MADLGIQAQEIRRRFGEVEALRGLDLRVPYGEVTALVGPNGAGKTTLLLILATLLAPDSGHLRIAGLDPASDPDAVRGRIGWMPDTFGVYDQLSTREYLDFFAAAYRLPRGSAEDRVEGLLETVHLAEFANQPVHVLSRGQKQRLGLARAFVHRPDILLLDEPASGLDPRSRVELRDLLRLQAQQGVAVLVSSHILTELEEIADGVVFVNKGATVSEHRMHEVNLGQHTTWRIRAITGDLPAALDRREIVHREAGAGVDVDLASEQQAAELLSGLIADGLQVVSFAPYGNDLESAYLAFTEERR